ncbi:hypothetical protein H0H87_004488, partial [Tephrocybe sp. NHM501043]
VFNGNTAVMAGILRVRGKQVTSALLNLRFVFPILLPPSLGHSKSAFSSCSSYYIIGIPFGMYLTFHFNMQLHGLWIGLTVSLIYCLFFGMLLSLRTNWDREVWKVMQRLKEQDKFERETRDGGDVEGRYCDE